MNNLSLIQWPGGKGRQLNDLLPFIPLSDLYVEPFGGGGSVLLNRSPSKVEVYNDLDGGLVNLFAVMRDDDKFARFRHVVNLVPYSRAEFERALDWETWDDDVIRAVGFYTMLNQSYSGMRLTKPYDWSRAMRDNQATKWFRRQAGLTAIHERVKGVQIECRDALDIVEEWDGKATTFYIDPPYVLGTRTEKYYAVEPDDEYHVRMIDVLLRVKGAVVLSGYEHPIYERLADEGKWVVDGYAAKAGRDATGRDAKKGKRREVIWRNARAAEYGARRPLFPEYDVVNDGEEDGNSGHVGEWIGEWMEKAE